VVTSGSGAAIRDIVNVITRRAPYVSVILRPAKVQGEGAAEEIALGIMELNEFADVDLLIVGRGGGSEEDLWCFNDEALARTIFESELPVISAVGHEIDFTIADFVADLRAPTPSAAAELAVRDMDDLLGNLQGYITTARRGLTMRVERETSQLLSIIKRPAWKEPLRILHDYEQRIDDFLSSADRTMLRQSERKISRLNNLNARLGGLALSASIKRGFVVVEKDGRTITKASELKLGDNVGIRWSDGEHKAEIVE
jgi:exodeoxyribonuclease VII large subunit